MIINEIKAKIKAKNKQTNINNKHIAFTIDYKNTFLSQLLFD